MEDELFSNVLSARRYGYQVFQRLLGDKPVPELFEAIDQDVLQESFSIVGMDDEAARVFMGALKNAPAELDEISSEYGRIFVGPNALPAPPWESIYVNKLQRLIMTVDTLAVRNAYLKEGFQPVLHGHVPDDHIAIELDFLASLATRALDAHLAGDAYTCDAALAASGEFLNAHLCRWVCDFAQDLEKRAESPFYACIAHAVDAFACADAKAVSGLAERR